ncbi:MAG TPA: hypothetical protein VN721_04685 [Flavipsychrobacter sp.]|nr:hypothetical protein [Flavipsychrobacter sp.]
MRYIWQHLNTITGTYTGEIPLAHFLKNYFKLNTKLGSRDRKMLSEMAYSWYRCEKGILHGKKQGIWDGEIDFEDKVKVCLLLCGAQEKLTKPFLPENWTPYLQKSVDERIAFLKGQSIEFSIDDLFYSSVEFSDGISRKDWLYSMLTQPKLFIRIRKGKEKITELLEKNQIDYEFVTDNCMALPNGAAIDKILPPTDYVVQDASSQQTGNYFKPQQHEKWYDCCAGAGGKSLLLKDMEPSVQLTVSDKRESILHNLKKRFAQYNHVTPISYIMDVADKGQLKKHIGNMKFDGIICDVPCSGSGTWARTPEQLYFPDTAAIDDFSSLQQRIAVNVSDYLKSSGRLIYITCSVLKEENENNVTRILNETDLQLEEQKLINGIEQAADSMFIAVLKKP